MLTDTSKRLQTYQLTLRALHLDDVDKLHELSVSVRWPHRPDDWRMLIALGGKGYVGCDPIGRIVASAMWFPMGGNFVTIGMLITSPRLQALGAGRWMMKHVMAQCAGQYVLLNATKAAYRLYESLAFQPITQVYQHQGIATPIVGLPAPLNAQVRSLDKEDLGDIQQLDQKAFGFDRQAIIQAILAKSSGSVLLRNNKIVGFALCRKFGRGHVIGPVVAQSSADAIALIAPHVSQHSGRFLRIDSDHQDSVFKTFLCQSGMPEYDTVTTMTKEPIKKAQTQYHSFALASQALN